jgi:hypothetical protein
MCFKKAEKSSRLAQAVECLNPEFKPQYCQKVNFFLKKGEAEKKREEIFIKLIFC